MLGWVSDLHRFRSCQYWGGIRFVLANFTVREQLQLLHDPRLLRICWRVSSSSFSIARRSGPLSSLGPPSPCSVTQYPSRAKPPSRMSTAALSPVPTTSYRCGMASSTLESPSGWAHNLCFSTGGSFVRFPNRKSSTGIDRLPVLCVGLFPG